MPVELTSKGREWIADGPATRGRTRSQWLVPATDTDSLRAKLNRLCCCGQRASPENQKQVIETFVNEVIKHTKAGKSLPDSMLYVLKELGIK